MRRAWGTIMRRGLVLILAGAGMLTALTGQAEPPPQAPAGLQTVTVVTGDWPPYVTLSDPKHGPMSEVIERVFGDAGLTVNFVFQPWKRSKNQVLEGEADVLMPAYCSPDRVDFYLCSDPVITGKQVLFHRIDTPLEWSSVSDLRGYIIGGTLGYFYGTEFEAAEKRGELDILRIASDEINMRLLMKGRIQLYPQDKAVGYAMLRELFPRDRWSEITCDEKPLHTQSLHLLFTRATPRGAELQSVFNAGLKHLRHTGELSRIMTPLTRRNEIMPVREGPKGEVPPPRPTDAPVEKTVAPPHF